MEHGKTIKKRIHKGGFGSTCFIGIGIAPTWILAKLGTKIKNPDGLILTNKDNLGAPIQGLCRQNFGIGSALRTHLAGLGIATCDQLKTTPENMLVANFGRTVGCWLYQSLRTDGNPVCRKDATDTTESPKSIGHSYTLSAEIYGRNIVFSWLRMLSEMVAQRARKSRGRGRAVCLWLNSRNESFVRQKTFSNKTRRLRSIRAF